MSCGLPGGHSCSTGLWQAGTTFRRHSEIPSLVRSNALSGPSRETRIRPSLLGAQLCRIIFGCTSDVYSLHCEGLEAAQVRRQYFPRRLAIVLASASAYVRKPRTLGHEAAPRLGDSYQAKQRCVRSSSGGGSGARFGRLVCRACCDSSDAARSIQCLAPPAARNGSLS